MQPFVKLMKQIEGTGNFSASGKLDPILPGLRIDGVGEVALPLSEHQALQIIQKCQQAPFGRGEKTLIDNSVRNVWQISPQAFKLANPEWNVRMENVCEKVAHQLGLFPSKFHFELYKLLVYTKGSFFIEHRDTEKLPNMLATLVVCLPSPHEGGELIVRQGDQTCQYSFAGQDKFNPEYAVFYADCYHEVKPVTSGYRLCLIYNLALENRTVQPLLAQQTPIVAEIEQLIKKWAEQGKIVTYLLDHSYSEQNLSMNNLKNHDFARASILLKLAEKHHCNGYLCLVSYLRESYGDCWDEGRFEEYDVSREEVFAHHLINLQDEVVGVDYLGLEEKDFLTEIPLRKGPGREESISEATGNEGATKELWYHRGAVILWPESRDLEVAMKANISYAAGYFKHLLQAQDISSGMSRNQAIVLANHILDRESYWNSDGIIDDLITLGDLELLRKFVRLRLSNGLLQIQPHILVKILDQFSWSTFVADINQIVQENGTTFHAQQTISWILKLLLASPRSSESRSIILVWFQRVWKLVLKIKDLKEMAVMLEEIFQILVLMESSSLTEEVLASLSEGHRQVSLPYVYAPAVQGVLVKYKKNQTPILQKIAEHFKSLAKPLYAHAPQLPFDGRRSGKIACPCEFCIKVNQFLQDPHHQLLYFEKTLRRNLDHLGDKIAENKLDLDLKIDRNPPKFVGTITKNQKSYRLALQQFNLVKDAQKQIEDWIHEN